MVTHQGMQEQHLQEKTLMSAKNEYSPSTLMSVRTTEEQEVNEQTDILH